ncbi:MAG TPA: phosphate ABC transporter permease subunit PstC [Spirochaetota bacterium]|nr:phosphate ABC transporter permease subunit PstC [Spirochaetota bacterium]HOR92960.1 phosphate ABC transporter permease subunit PstC [Spirochaetota bacterium]HOT19330.1 phosphate ABC transporter permease subunit PstC [Spirochaetota bacterium]HPD05277.1 phosphate ABC transporter permease subunit PstC [Spirochaetota bacterium]HQG41405.1 phosphate ABC transporter permease subunit PstC [Spirochaetota bacterium]
MLKERLKIALNIHTASDRIIRYIFAVVGFVSVAFLFLIMIFLFKEGLPVFNSVSVKEFLFGTSWYPTSVPPKFGTLPLIVASLTVTFFAAAFAVPFSMAIAIYLSELAPATLREIVKPIIELIASIPSVIIGFFGMVVVAPFLQDHFDIDTGLNVLNAAIMLAFMAIPTIASISEDALSSVPASLKEASYALGANRWQTIVHITMPAALSGVWTAIILGISRVLGETMVVLMVAGGATIFPTSLFDPVRPLTANIAAEMAEASYRSDHYFALFAIGIILFVLTLLFNVIANYLSMKYKFKWN